MTDSWKSYVLMNHICIWYLQVVWLSCWEYSWPNDMVSRSWWYVPYQLAYEGVEELTDLWLNIFVGSLYWLGPHSKYCMKPSPTVINTPGLIWCQWTLVFQKSKGCEPRLLKWEEGTVCDTWIQENSSWYIWHRVLV